MEDTVIVVVLEDKNTGILDKELGCYKILYNDDLIVNVFAVETEEGLLTHIKLSTDRDVEDWEFSPIYDNYDADVFDTKIKALNEVEDCFNPTWELVFEFVENTEQMEQKLNEILDIHKQELQDVYAVLQENKELYTE